MKAKHKVIWAKTSSNEEQKMPMNSFLVVALTFPLEAMKWLDMNNVPLATSDDK